MPCTCICAHTCIHTNKQIVKNNPADLSLAVLTFTRGITYIEDVSQSRGAPLFPNMQIALGQPQARHKLGTVIHACNDYGQHSSRDGPD